MKPNKSSFIQCLGYYILSAVKLNINKFIEISYLLEFNNKEIKYNAIVTKFTLF